MLYLTLAPEGKPAVIMEQALRDQTRQIDLLLSIMPGLTHPQQLQDSLTQLIVATATSQLILTRLLLKEYH